MKIKAINFNQRVAFHSRKNRCFSAYHNCINSARCNKLFGLIFLMSIGAIFTAVIVTAVIRAELFDDYTASGNTTRGNDSTQNAIEVLQESFTTFEVANKFDEVMEIPGNHQMVLDEEVSETTDNSSTPLDTSSSTTVTTTSTTTESTTSPTTIIPPTTPKCSIINSTSTPLCTVSCSDVTIDALQNEIMRAIDVELPNFSNCWTYELGLALDRVYYDNQGTESYWLANLGRGTSFITTTIFKTAFDEISDNTFNSSTFSQMKILTITDCKNVFLFNGSFIGLTRLETLKISNLYGLFHFITNANPLLPLSENLMNLEVSNIESGWSPIRLLGSGYSFTKMKRIIFTGNNFTTTNFNFTGVSATIEEINLGNSRITQLADDVFRNCVKLTNLYLNNNMLTSLTPTIFDDLVELKILLLSNNQLTSLPEGLFSRFGSIELRVHFSFNPWRCDNEILYLRKLIENTTTNFIFLTGTDDITCSDPFELQGTKISELWCTFKNCKISCKETDDSSLMAVMDIFNTLSCGTLELELISHRFINKRIPREWLTNLPYNLTIMSIIASNLEFIDDNAFGSSTFNDLKEMTINGEFPDDTSLQLLNQKVFLGLNNLRTLEITNYKSINIVQQTPILQGVDQTLVCLSVTNIENSFFIRNLFFNTTFAQLKKLDMSGNQFSNTAFTVSTFVGLHGSLENLIMSNSRVSNISATTFNSFVKLKELHLEDNNLMTLPNGVFQNFTNSSDFQVFLRNNSWICNLEICHLLPFLNEIEVVLCASPENLKGQSMREIENLCSETATTSTEIITTTTIPPTTTTTLQTTTLQTTTTKPPTTTSSSTPTSTAATSTTAEETTVTTTRTTTTTTPETTTETQTTPTVPSTTTTEQTTESSSKTISLTSTTDENDETPITNSTITSSTTGLPGEGDEGVTIPCNGRMLSRSILDHYRSLTIPNRDSITIYRPPVMFDIELKDSANEVEITFDSITANMAMLYYPFYYNPFDTDTENDDLASCIPINEPVVTIGNLIQNVVYTFCSIHQERIMSPLQCKSYATIKGMPWLYMEQKTVIITSLSLILFFVLLIGIILTYFLIRRVPTLIKGSKRVVLVNNRSKEVMILPRSNNDSRNNSYRKESSVPVIPPEPPTYLTPLPRQSLEHQRPPLIRSNSDTSLKSYVSVSRMPPRFSQVFQDDDFDSLRVARNRNGYPRQLSVPYQQSPEMPPPLPRRSIVSNVSSAHHSIASNGLSRSNNHHNSTFRRHQPPTRIAPEEENHYNIII